MRLVVAIAALSLARTALAAGELSAWGGVNYSSGSYGGAGTTEVFSVPLAARHENGPWILRGSLPWLHITGTGVVVVPGVGPVGSSASSSGPLDPVTGLLPGGGNANGNAGAGGGTPGTTRTTRTTVSGIGDATASATYMLYGADNRSGAGLTGKVKLPTGDENQGLGTGSTDLSAQADVFRTFGATTFFAGLGYTVFGDSPVAQLDSVANGSLGFVQRLGENDRAGLALDARQAGSPLPAAQQELSAFWIHRVGARWRMHAYVLKGFADGSPDWGGGLSAGYVF